MEINVRFSNYVLWYTKVQWDISIFIMKKYMQDWQERNESNCDCEFDNI